MQIIPAIDIKNGKCVRLFQGDYDKETIYSSNPIEMALNWKNQGAKIIHIVDLDGAKSGKSKITKIVQKIINDVRIPVEIGGGIRNLITMKRLFNIGVTRIILGTVALEKINLLKKLIDLYGDKVIVSVDVNNGMLMKKGWLEVSNFSLIPIIKQIEKVGVKTVIFTDITRDGTLTEPNYKNIMLIRKNTKMKLIIAGGISSINQIKKLQRIKVDGVIIGKALYEEKINLKEVIKYVS